MGSSTFIHGVFRTNKPVSTDLMQYINRFAFIRHMTRNNQTIQTVFSDWEKHCWHGNLGTDGEFFIGGPGRFGQDYDDSVTNYNMPGGSCPSLWCQWIMPDRQTIMWDGGEKFHDPDKWLQYLIDHFFKSEGIELHGAVSWYNDGNDQSGIIRVQNNQVFKLTDEPYDPSETNVPDETHYSPAEFAKLLHVTVRRLVIWEQNYQLFPYRPDFDTCFYTQSQLDMYKQS